jgi:polysaccharide biosynthesis transport protein
MNSYTDPAATISLADVFKGVLRRPLRIALCTLLGLGAGLLILRMAEPTYQTEAQILIERRDVPRNEDGTKNQEQPQPIDERLITSQVAVISSNDFASRVVNKLKLAENEEFSPATLKYGVLKSLAVSMGFVDDKRNLSRERRAVDALSSSITVYSQRESDVINIRAEAESPEMAAQVANALADEYLETSGTGDEKTKRIQDWLSAQITELRGKVSASEAAVEEFRTRAGLLRGTNSTLGVQEISELNSQLTIAEAAEKEAEARANAIKEQLETTGTVDATTEVLNSPIVQTLQEQRIIAQRRLTELSATYLPNHPRIKAANSEIAEIDRQVRRQASKIVAGLDSQSRVAASRAQSIRDKLEILKQREGAANLEEVKLKALEREASANRQLLETLLARYVEVNTQKDLDVRPTLARIIQQATIPSAIAFPKPGPTVLLTTLAGLALGLGLAFLSAIMRLSSAPAYAPRPVREIEPQVAQYTQQQQYTPAPPPVMPRQAEPAPVFAPTPAHVQPAQPYESPKQNDAAESRFNDIVPTAPVVLAAPAAQPEPPLVQDSLPTFANPDAVTVPASSSPTLGTWDGARQLSDRSFDAAIDPGAEPDSDGLTANILALQERGAARHFAFTRVGCVPLESAIAVQTASTELAAMRKRVLVIDLDHERAELERLFGLPDGGGLLDLLAGQADFSKLIARDARTGVHIIRLGDISNAREPEALATQIRAILRSIQGIYDFVLLHVGQVNASALPYLLTCDVAIILAPPTHDAEVLQAVETLSAKAAIQVLHVSVDRQPPPPAAAQEIHAV